MLRRCLPLWGGAVLVGLAVGIGPSLWPNAATVATNLPSIAPQTILQEQATAEDESWATRSTEKTTAETTVSFGICHTGGGTNCVVDGDTIWMAGQNIRIADVDTPETHDYRCPAEKELGDRATQRATRTGEQRAGDASVDRTGRGQLRA